MGTTFRIALFEGHDSFASDLALIAAKCNGTTDKLTLEQLKASFDVEKFRYSSLQKDTTCDIIGGTLLHIDKKIGDEYKTVLSIQQVEIFELAKPDPK